MNWLFINKVYVEWDRISEDSYLRRIESLHNLEELEFDNPVTFFAGENGSGKSTLLEAMAVAYGFNPEGGTRNYSFSTYDSHSELHEAIRLSRGPKRSSYGYFLRAESFYNVATKEDEYARDTDPRYARHFHEKSHGESFLSLINTEFRGNSLYFLDEPEAALSPQRQLSLLLAIHRCIRDGAQFFIVTHSPILLGFPGAKILSFDDGFIHECAYEDTGSYQITEMFLHNRDQLLRHLFEED